MQELFSRAESDCHRAISEWLAAAVPALSDLRDSAEATASTARAVDCAADLELFVRWNQQVAGTAQGIYHLLRQEVEGERGQADSADGSSAGISRRLSWDGEASATLATQSSRASSYEMAANSFSYALTNTTAVCDLAARFSAVCKHKVKSSDALTKHWRKAASAVSAGAGVDPPGPDLAAVPGVARGDGGGGD